jgi:RNA polymerase sigma factor (sigma-70 family)
MNRQLSATPFPSAYGTSVHEVVATDGELLTQWVKESDAVSLDNLIRRHGGMVLGVCRRILGNSADAEDAFQVTFLILVKKARTLVSPGQVAGWLHGVAFQVSRRMRADLSRRRQRETKMVSEHPAPDSPEDMTDARRIIDEELNRLPDKYRLPILLCELEGLTLDEAARRLGWPRGTVAGRLSRGRDILRRRLSRRRGLALPMVMLGAPSLPGLESIPVDLPDELVSTTVHAVGNPDGPTAVTAAAIAEAIGHDVTLRSWLKYTIAILIAIILAATGLKAHAAITGQSLFNSQQGPDPQEGSGGGACHHSD